MLLNGRYRLGRQTAPMNACTRPSRQIHRRLALSAVLTLLWLSPIRAAAGERQAETNRFIADVHGIVNHEHRVGSEADF